MNLQPFLGTLMQELEKLAQSSGFPNARVLSKVNFRGELVLGVILRPKAAGLGPERPSCRGRPVPAPPTDAREEKRLARQRRS
jgi:hypothetical protein